jgi:hypothetical protein
VTYSTGENTSSVVVGDFDGDGHLDFAVANAGINVMSLFFGNGDGTFAPRVDFDSGKGVYTLAVGDLNGDGRPDLVVSNLVGDSVSVLLGQACAP